MSAQAEYTGEFRKDLADSDALHWGEGTVSVGDRFISFMGELAPGPDYKPSGLTKVLRLFTDEDDSDPSVGVEFPRNVWRVVSNAFLFDMLGIPAIRAEAERVGIVPEE